METGVSVKVRSNRSTTRIRVWQGNICDINKKMSVVRLRGPCWSGVVSPDRCPRRHTVGRCGGQHHPASETVEKH